MSNLKSLFMFSERRDPEQWCSFIDSGSAAKILLTFATGFAFFTSQKSKPHRLLFTHTTRKVLPPLFPSETEEETYGSTYNQNQKFLQMIFLGHVFTDICDRNQYKALCWFFGF